MPWSEFKGIHGLLRRFPPPRFSLLIINRIGFAHENLQSAPSGMRKINFFFLLKKSRQLLTSCLAVYLWTISFILSYLCAILKCLEFRLEERSEDSWLVLKERRVVFSFFFGGRKVPRRNLCMSVLPTFGVLFYLPIEYSIDFTFSRVKSSNTSSTLKKPQ